MLIPPVFGREVHVAKEELQSTCPVLRLWRRGHASVDRYQRACTANPTRRVAGSIMGATRADRDRLTAPPTLTMLTISETAMTPDAIIQTPMPMLSKSGFGKMPSLRSSVGPRTQARANVRILVVSPRLAAAS